MAPCRSSTPAWPIPPCGWPRSWSSAASLSACWSATRFPLSLLFRRPRAMSRRAYNWIVVASALIAYFVIFPADLGFVADLLRLTQAVATGAWALLIAVVVVGGAVRIWGRGANAIGRSAVP